MTDKTIAELAARALAAAKAAGILIDYSTTNGGGRFNTGFDALGNAVLDWHNGTKWNPLTDDGDALRLAVKLRLELGFGVNGRVYAFRRGDAAFREVGERIKPDAMAATRRTITRAAASLAAAPAGEASSS